MKKSIIIQSEGRKTTGIVTESEQVTLSSTASIQTIIENGAREVADILSGGGVEDPSKKKCSRCVKMGRMPFHSLNDFSIVQSTGKPHSQCKVCRTEQAVEWQNRKHIKEARRDYHREYNKIRRPPQRRPEALKEFYKAMQEADNTINADNALFVAVTDDNIDITE